MSEISNYEAQKKKLQGLCDEHNFTFRFFKDRYPITLVITPINDIATQMDMLGNVEETGYCSQDSSMCWYFENSELKTKVKGSVVLLEQLKAFTEKIMSDMILPVAMQQGDTEQAYRAPEVYLMRLPDSRSAKKKAPYIIHRVIPLATEQQPGSEERTVVSVRSIFCCYNPDEQEGDLALLNMMERFRVELLKVRKVGGTGTDGRHRYQFTLDISPDHKLESIPYDEESKPYYAGEMITYWKLPTVQQTEDIELWR